MKKLIAGATALILLAGCEQKTVTEEAVDATAELVSGIDVEWIDDSVEPGDDFFAYVNGRWEEQFEIPADKSNYGSFTKLSDAAEEDVKAIIEMSATGDFAKGTDEQRVGDLYKSYLDMEARNARGVEPLQPELDRIAAISDYDELSAYFAGATKRGYGMPFGLAQFPDMKNPGFYGVYAFQGGLGLPDREYYFNDDDKSAALREQYVAHIETMFDLAGFEGGADAAQIQHYEKETESLAAALAWAEPGDLVIFLALSERDQHHALSPTPAMARAKAASIGIGSPPQL